MRSSEMKKKNLWAILATVIMALPLFVGFGGTSANAAGEDPVEKTTATIIVHKVANDGNIPDDNDEISGNEIENNGEIVEGLTPISGVEFNIYDMTPGSTNYGKVVGNGKTISDGTVTFPDLPKTITKVNAKGEKEEVYAKYKIVEVSAPEYVTDKAGDIEIQFPVYKVGKVDEDKITFTDEELDPIHVYPKNEVFGAAPKFEKYGRVGNNGEETPLDGAEFKMYRLKEDGTKEYLQVLPEGGTPSDITWDTIDGAETFTSKTITDENGNEVSGIVSVEDTNPNYLLPAGTYYFEETATGSDLYSVPKAEQVIKVVIGKNDAGKPTFEYTVNPDYASNEEGNEGGENKISRVVNQSAKLTKEKVSEGSDFNYGQAIDYKVTVDVPKSIATDYSQFNVTDTPDEGLVFDAGSLKVKLLQDESLQEVLLKEGTDYILTSNPAFTIDFDMDPAIEGLQLSPAVKVLAGKTLEINYQMSIEEGTKPDKDLNNSAVVNLTPAPTKPVKPDPVETYGKKFMKVDSADDSIGLVGAEFAVKNSDGKYLTSINGVYGWADSVDAKGVVKITSGSDGSFEIKGLEAGKYFLEELVAPDQYAKLLNDLEFTVAEGSYSKVEPLDVKNTHKGKLPSTGGTGIIAFVAIGVVAVAGAALYFTKGRRQIEG